MVAWLTPSCQWLVAPLLVESCSCQTYQEPSKILFAEVIDGFRLLVHKAGMGFQKGHF